MGEGDVYPQPILEPPPVRRHPLLRHLPRHILCMYALFLHTHRVH